MAEQVFKVNCGFFDSINDDRLYTADDMNRPYRRLVSNGVFATPYGTPSTDLQVFTADEGMNIIVKKGEGIFDYKWFENPNDLIITVPTNTSIVPRIDSVIIQVDKTQEGRNGNIVYREGNPSSSPVPPDININENIVEYRLANVYVSISVNTIGQDVITDLRGSSECPWVTGLIEQVDTSTLFEQYQGWLERETNNAEVEIEELIENFRESILNLKTNNEEQSQELIEELRQYCTDKESEADFFIVRLREMLEELSKDFVPSEVVSVNNSHYSSKNLDGVLTEISEKIKEQIIVSETEPEQDCIWYKVLSSRRKEPEDTIMLLTTELDGTEIYISEIDGKEEKVINADDDLKNNGNITFEEV